MVLYQMNYCIYVGNPEVAAESGIRLFGSQAKLNNKPFSKSDKVLVYSQECH